MSGEVLRSWSGKKPNKRRSRRRNPFFRYLILFLVLTTTIWTWWTTRDTHPIGSLLTKDQAFHVLLNDILQKRYTIAQSELWDMLPEDHPAQDVPEALAMDIAVPEWIQKNLIPGRCHIAGTSMDHMEQALFISKMTRTGVLLERFRGYAGNIEEDFAGGLRLRHVPDAGIYYAVRGRVLLVSADRRSLIQALTLHADEAMGQEALEQLIAQQGDEALYLVLNEAPEPVNTAFAKAELKIWLEGRYERMRVTGEIGPRWREKIETFLPKVKPAQLRVQEEGLIELSMNMGLSLADSIQVLEALMETPLNLVDQLQALPYFQDETNTAISGLLTALLNNTGPSIQLTWTGIEPYAIVPMPELMLHTAVQDNSLGVLLPLLPAPNALSPEQTIPRYNPETGLAYLPLIGGPAIEPSLYIDNGQLHLSNSRTALEGFKSNPTPMKRWSEPANLYVRVDPGAVIDAIHTLGMELAVIGLLRDHDEASFTKEMESWHALLGDVDTVYLTAAHDSGQLTLDFRIELDLPVATTVAPVESLQ